MSESDVKGFLVNMPERTCRKLYPDVTELLRFMSRRVKVYSGLHSEESLSRSQFHSMRMPMDPPWDKIIHFVNSTAFFLFVCSLHSTLISLNQ